MWNDTNLEQNVNFRAWKGLFCDCGMSVKAFTKFVTIKPEWK